LSKYEFLEVLGSRAKVKLVLALVELGSAGITRLVRETGLNHAVVKKNIMELMEMGVVTAKQYDNYTIYMLNENNSLVRMIKELLQQG
jgi:predicted transcriptional regulator